MRCLNSSMLKVIWVAKHQTSCILAQEFNAGIFDYLIATDDGTSVPGNENERRSDEKAKQEAPSSQGPIRNRRKVPVDEEFSVTRGIDFKDVHTVAECLSPKFVFAAHLLRYSSAFFSCILEILLC